MTAPSILSLTDVCYSFGGLRAVDHATFDVPPGQITSLIGPNGAGKTTIFNVVSGVLSAQQGEVKFCSAPIQTLPPHRIAALGIGRTFQAPRVFPEMSVLANVMVGVRQRSERLFSAIVRGPRYATEVKATQERSEQLLDAVGLLSRAHEPAARLSFGEQRFLSIARTLVSKPQLIMMDEPTVGLDDEALVKLTRIMTDVVSASGASLLLIEHHMDTVMSISQKIVLLVQGAVVISGNPDTIKNSRAMLEAYLGKKDVA
jgi:ABC-type branched-subunit amino acid transport system ATPase component